MKTRIRQPTGEFTANSTAPTNALMKTDSTAGVSTALIIAPSGICTRISMRIVHAAGMIAIMDMEMDMDMDMDMDGAASGVNHGDAR
jgi:hypothetical protein